MHDYGLSNTKVRDQGSVGFCTEQAFFNADEDVDNVSKIQSAIREAVRNEELMAVIIDGNTNTNMRQHQESMEQMTFSHVARVQVCNVSLPVVTLCPMRSNMSGGTRIHMSKAEF